jgi:hypothetical protein
MYTTLVKTYSVFLYPQPALWLQPSYVQKIIHVCPTFIVSFILCPTLCRTNHDISTTNLHTWIREGFKHMKPNQTSI